MKPVREESSPELDRWCEALDWYATLRSADAIGLTPAVGRDWQEWYAAPENRCVFDALACLMTASRACRRARLPGRAERRDDRYDLCLPIAEWRRVEGERVKSGRHRRLRAWWRLPGGLGLAAIASALVLLSFRFAARHGETRPVTYETGAGAIKEISLKDGSRVVLGQRTRLTVAYSARRRSVKLATGRAWFKVEHDAHRPFVVAAGDERITDVGTTFAVTRESGRVLVAVIVGKVKVSARPAVWRQFRQDIGLGAGPPLQPVALTSGEQLSIADNGVLGQITRTDARVVKGCACAPLTFDNESLGEVIRTVNRYSPLRIDLDPSVEALRISAVVFPDEIPEWLRRLPEILPVEVDNADHRVRIRSAPAASDRQHRKT